MSHYRKLLPLLLLGVLLIQLASAAPISKYETTDNNTEFRITLELNENSILQSTITVFVGVQLVSLGTDINDLHDIIINGRMDNGVNILFDSVSFLKRDTDSLKTPGDAVNSSISFLLYDTKESTYSIQLQVSVTEDKTASFDPEYQSQWSTFTTITFNPTPITFSESSSELPGLTITTYPLAFLVSLVFIIIVVIGMLLLISRKNTPKTQNSFNSTMKEYNEPKIPNSFNNTVKEYNKPKKLRDLKKIQATICPQCGTSYQLGDSFCQHCGGKLEK